MKQFNGCRGAISGSSAFSYKDLRIVEKQLMHHNFEPNLVECVSCRCQWGYPQALMCRPHYKNRPFPTLFWLTCPYLSKVCGALESDGGVQAMEHFLSMHAASYKIFNRAYALLRLRVLGKTEQFFLRAYRPKLWNVLALTGIGGMRSAASPSVKCLHLQTATILSMKWHPAERWLRKKLGKCCCENGQCGAICS